jgi:hypothetical protein
MTTTTQAATDYLAVGKVYAQNDLRTYATEASSLLHQSVEWSSSNQAICNMFMAFPTRAFTLKSLVTSIAGVEGIEFYPETIEASLKQLIKAKAIRKRRIQGQVFYELALI